MTTMKKMLFIAAAAALYACGNGADDHAGHDHSDDRVIEDHTSIAINSYGVEFDTTGAVLFDAANFEADKTDGVYRATIVESCQKMGCWMKVEHPGQGEVMVFMNDHAFFVPKTGVSGLTAYMTGTAYWDTTSVDLQKHLLEDANAAQEEIDAITEDKYELQFNAMGVTILGYVGEEAEGGHDHDHDHDHDHSEATSEEGEAADEATAEAAQ